MIETLETRVLHAAQSRPSFAVAHYTLAVTGTPGNDSIVVKKLNGAVDGPILLRLNGKKYTVTQRVKRIVIDGGAGDDYIAGARLSTAPPTVINGGDGNDILDAGYDHDTLIGGNGNDKLNGYEFGGGTRIYMDGGDGNDKLTYGYTMYGGRGHDIAEFLQGEFTGTPITGGVEKFRNPGVQHATLFTRNGRLVFDYPRPFGASGSFSKPFVRTDGQVQITFKDSPDDVLEAKFNDRYTALASARGVQIVHYGPDDASPDGVAVTVLIPQT